MHTLVMPRLGQTMTSGTLLEWLIEEDTAYAEGAPLYVIETDKSVLDVEATLPGAIVRKIAEPGQELPVGSLVAVATNPGEFRSQEDIERFIAEVKIEGEAVDESFDAEGQNASRSQEAAVTVVSAPNSVRAMPRAKRLARELGIELNSVTGSGPGGVITEQDVQRFAGQSAPAEQQPAPLDPRIRARRRLRGIARAVAEQMIRSWKVPQFSQDIEIDAEPMLRRRQQLASAGHAVSVTDLLLEALVIAAQQVPECNATYDGDELVSYETIDVGVAVATRHGLLVPVLRDCGTSVLADRSTRLAALLTRARDGLLGPDELASGTITLSNLGMTRIETGVPIVNTPQVCLVFTGTVVEKAVVRNGAIVAGRTMHVVCAYDHRVIDGQTGARFTTALCDNLVAG